MFALSLEGSSEKGFPAAWQEFGVSVSPPPRTVRSAEHRPDFGAQDVPFVREQIGVLPDLIVQPMGRQVF